MGMPNSAERWTRDAVLALPDDGQRYELVSGALVVTPAPRGLHQRAVAALYLRLQEWLGRHPVAHVLFSPADITLGEDETLQPDLFVYRTASGEPLRDWTDIAELLLVIEVTSPRTAGYDRELKRRRYQRAGVAEYWVIDLDAGAAERWRPGDDTPEVMTDELRWQPAPGGPAMVVGAGKFFRDL